MSLCKHPSNEDIYTLVFKDADSFYLGKKWSGHKKFSPTDVGSNSYKNKGVSLSVPVGSTFELVQGYYHFTELDILKMSNLTDLRIDVEPNNAVAFLDDKFVGFLSWHDDGCIAHVSVLEAYRNQGIATRLFEASRNVCRFLHHSDRLTDDGALWVESLGNAGAGKSENIFGTEKLP